MHHLLSYKVTFTPRMCIICLLVLVLFMFTLTFIKGSHMDWNANHLLEILFCDVIQHHQCHMDKHATVLHFFTTLHNSSSHIQKCTDATKTHIRTKSYNINICLPTKTQFYILVCVYIPGKTRTGGITKCITIFRKLFYIFSIDQDPITT